MSERNKKVQNSSYNKNKTWGCDVQKHNDVEKNWPVSFKGHLYKWPTRTWNKARHHSSFVVQSLNRVQCFETPWTVVRQACLSFTVSQSLLKLMSIESLKPFNHFILFCTLLLLPSIFQTTMSYHCTRTRMTVTFNTHKITSRDEDISSHPLLVEI